MISWNKNILFKKKIIQNVYKLIKNFFNAKDREIQLLTNISTPRSWQHFCQLILDFIYVYESQLCEKLNHLRRTCSIMECPQDKWF